MQACTTPRSYSPEGTSQRAPILTLQSLWKLQRWPCQRKSGEGGLGPLGVVCPQPSVLSCPGDALFSAASLWLSLHLSVLSPVFISPHLSFCLCAISCLSPSLTSCCLSLCICLTPLLFLSLLSVSFPCPPALLCLGGLHLSLSVSVPRALLPLAPSGG